MARIVQLRSLALAACVAALPAIAGDGPEDLAKDALKRFGEGLSDKDIPVVEEALADFDSIYLKVSAKTVKKLDKAIGKLFKLEPRKEFREDGSDPREELLNAYGLAVGTVFDKESGHQLLVTALKQKHVKRWADAQALFIEGLGHRIDPDNVGLFADYLEADEPAVTRAAAEAIGRYAEQDLSVRREGVKELIDALVVHHTAAAKEAKKGKAEEAQEYMLAVEGSFHESLVALSRQRFEEAPEWSAWFREHGAEDGW